MIINIMFFKWAGLMQAKKKEKKKILECSKINVYNVYEDAWRERANLSRHMPEALVPDDRQDARLFRLTLQPPKPGQVASQLKQQRGKINHSTRA